jgi:outer membrane murein-binding lipoprotein Lpp
MEQRAWSQTEIKELKAKSAKVDQLETDLRALSEEIRSNLPPAE